MAFISMTFFLGHSALDYGQFWVDSLSFHIVLNIYNFTSTLEGYGFRIAWKHFLVLVGRRVDYEALEKQVDANHAIMWKAYMFI